MVSSLHVGDAGNTSLVDAGTPLGAAAVVTPGSAGPVVGEMLSAARFAAVGMVGRPLTHVDRMRASPRSGNSTGTLPQLLL